MDWLLFFLAQVGPDMPQPVTPIVVPVPQITTWDVGPGLAAMLIAVVTAIGTTITVILNTILAAKSRQEAAAKLEEVKHTGDETHKIVNSQRTEMTADLKRVNTELNTLKEALREVTTSRDLARAGVAPEEKKIQIEIKTEEPKKPEEPKTDA